MDRLTSWLSYIESLHPQHIALGLERITLVRRAMGLDTLPCVVINVAGTNGKGSVAALMEAVIMAAGYRVGVYASPHLVRYNERVRIDGHDVDDADLIRAFERIETARGDTALTYFEYGTLAAVDLMCRADVDVAILEVGLGGRLDAVNAFEPDVAVVTSIGLDHTDWLGPDREAIAREKAGIFRTGIPAICGDDDAPDALIAQAHEVGAPLYVAGTDFRLEADGSAYRFLAPGIVYDELPQPALVGVHQLANAAAALMALAQLQMLSISTAAIRAGLAQARLRGRMQIIGAAPEIIVDVAHNPDAMAALRSALGSATDGLTHAIVGMMADKDYAAALGQLAPIVDVWHLTDLSPPRGARAHDLRAALASEARASGCHEYANPLAAFEGARQQAGDKDRILVTGSFETVGVILASVEAE